MVVIALIAQKSLLLMIAYVLNCLLSTPIKDTHTQKNYLITTNISYQKKIKRENLRYNKSSNNPNVLPNNGLISHPAPKPPSFSNCSRPTLAYGNSQNGPPGFHSKPIKPVYCPP